MTKAKFDRSEVVESALQLFWQYGYTTASMQKVIEATGLKPGSIYLAFKSKEGLFQEALTRYAEKGLLKIKDTIENAPNTGKGICLYLEDVIQSTKNNNYSSCFLIKTSLELVVENKKLHTAALIKLTEMEELFYFYLEQEYGKKGSKQRATSVMLHIFGVRQYGLQSTSISKMRKGIREGLPWLPWD